jgi:hypothetical protein
MLRPNILEDRKMVLKRVLGCLFVMTLASGVLLAQDGLKVAHTTPSHSVTPYKSSDPAGIKTIFSNLGPNASDEYNDATGYYVLGPDNSVGLSEQWIALPFTPKANAHIVGLQVAIGLESGTSLVDVGLYSDSSGTVGTVLASGHSTNIPAFGSCCQLVGVPITPTAVTAGTQYWVVASSDDTNAPDFTGVFEASNQSNIAGDVGEAGWFTFSGNVPAVAVKGTIP